MKVLWAPKRESECGKYLKINGLSESYRKIDLLGPGKEQQNVLGWKISEEGTKLLKSEGINFKYLADSGNAKLLKIRPIK